MSTDWKMWLFCPFCDYAVSRRQVERSEIDQPCPQCHDSSISCFYSYGSMKHARRCDDFNAGRVTGCPVPFPIKGMVPVEVVEKLFDTAKEEFQDWDGDAHSCIECLASVDGYSDTIEHDESCILRRIEEAIAKAKGGKR